MTARRGGTCRHWRAFGLLAHLGPCSAPQPAAFDKAPACFEVVQRCMLEDEGDKCPVLEVKR